MDAPISKEELDWAKECLASGDTLEEIAEWSGRTPEDWRAALGALVRLAERHRAKLTLLDMGAGPTAIARELGHTRESVKQVFDRMRARGLPVRRFRGASRGQGAAA